MCLVFSAHEACNCDTKSTSILTSFLEEISSQIKFARKGTGVKKCRKEQKYLSTYLHINASGSMEVYCFN